LCRRARRAHEGVSAPRADAGEAHRAAAPCRGMTAMLPQVDVFWADLDAAASALPRWQALLDSNESTRAARFHFARDRHRYIASHGILRMLLARYLDRAPAALCFAIGSHGKPALREDELRFNLSHSRHLALFAVSRA